MSILNPSRGLEPTISLEAVIDPPLEPSERPDHENPWAKPKPESLEPDLLIDLLDCHFKSFLPDNLWFLVDF